MARRLANLPGAHQHRFAVDEHGRILNLDATDPEAALTSDQYEPPPRIARHVITRDRHCIHPGFPRRLRLQWRGDPHCRRAVDCQLDHRIPWPDGPTSAENLQPLCKRHHDLKHHSNWHVRKCLDGSYEWTSPTRHTYRYRPPEPPTPATGPEPEAEAVQLIEDDDPPPF
jgi:hypothetical protein